MEVIRSDRFGKQNSRIPRARLLEESVTVIGTGGIGRQVALQLVALGIPKLQLIDPAIVRATDVTSAGFHDEDVGKPKVDMVGHQCHQTEPLLDLEAVYERFNSRHEVGNSVFCCVDSAEARPFIWNAVADRCRFWGDGRLEVDRVRVLAATSEQSRRDYADSFSPGNQDDSGAHSPVSSTIYESALGAALLIDQYVRHLRGLPLIVDAAFDFSIGSYVKRAL